MPFTLTLFIVNTFSSAWPFVNEINMNIVAVKKIKIYCLKKTVKYFIKIFCKKNFLHESSKRIRKCFVNIFFSRKI